MFTRTESFREFIRLYPIVSMIVAIHIGLFLFTILPFFPNSLIFENFQGVNLYIMEGEYWRLVTPIFMHSGFPHMLFNSFSLILFGPSLERMLGKSKFLFLYLVTGIIANLATLLLKPLTYTHVGSSGAIFGLFGIYLAMVVFRKDMLSRQNSQVILTIVALGVIMTFLQPNINVTAHLFGLISGFFIGSFTIGNRTHVLSTFKSVSKQAFYVSPTKRRRFSLKSLFWLLIILLTIIGILSR